MKTKRDNDSFYERRFCGARIMQMAEMWIYLINRKRLHFGFIFIRKLFAMSAHSQMFAHGRREENCLCEQQTAATATPALFHIRKLNFLLRSAEVKVPQANIRRTFQFYALEVRVLIPTFDARRPIQFDTLTPIQFFYVRNGEHFFRVFFG